MEGQSSAVVGQAFVKNKRPRKKKGGHWAAKHQNRQTRAFVELSWLILGDAIVPSNCRDTGLSAFDPMGGDNLVPAQILCLSGGGLCYDYDGLDRNGFLWAADSTPGRVDLQPLVTKKRYPHFGRFVRVLSPYPMGPATNDIFTYGFESNNVFETVPDSGKLQGAAPDPTLKGPSSAFSYVYKTSQVSLNTGFAWINNISDTSGLSQTFQKAGFESTVDRVSGLNLNIGASYGAFSLTGGYIRALDRYIVAQPSFNANETEPGAWTSEVAYTTELLSKATVLAVGYQKSSEVLRVYLPEERYITKASMAVSSGMILSLEYYLDKDYPVETGGGNGDGYGVISRIGFEFQIDR